MLRIFETDDNQRRCRTDDFDFETEKMLLSSLASCVTKHYGYFHICAHVSAVLSLLVIYCNNLISDGNLETDSVAVRVINYIETNFTEHISLEYMEKKFFVSSSTLNKIVKRMTSFTFWEYITELRLHKAYELLRTGRFTALKVSMLCGFGYYSTFFRAYKKKYGVSPTSDIPYTGEEKWPLA